MNIYEKLAVVQQEVKAPKNQKNTHMKFNYRSAEGILEAVKPILARVGATITLTDKVVEIGGRIYVKATAAFFMLERPNMIMHENGEVENILPEAPIEVEAYAREADSKPGLDVAQVTGSASSYARKYALNGLLLLDDAKQDPDTEDNTRRTEQAEQEATRKATQEATITLYASPDQLDTIHELAELAGVDLSAIGEDLDTMTAKRADAMIARLKERLGK